MRAVVQRVYQAGVAVEKQTVGAVRKGLVVFLGVGHEDSEADVVYMAGKIAGLRIFQDEEGQMNLSVKEARGEVLVISQFTLYGDCRKGRRPGFSAAAPPGKAEELYERFCELLRSHDIEVATGRFQAEMRVLVDNHGPVTILLDSKKLF